MELAEFRMPCSAIFIIQFFYGKYAGSIKNTSKKNGILKFKKNIFFALLKCICLYACAYKFHCVFVYFLGQSYVKFTIHAQFLHIRFIKYGYVILF